MNGSSIIFSTARILNGLTDYVYIINNSLLNKCINRIKLLIQQQKH